MNQQGELLVVKREDRDGVSVITIRRPEVLNAINADAIAQLERRFREVEDDDGVRAVVLTGHGDKAFAAGADIGYLSSLDTPEAAEAMCLEFQGAIGAIENSSKPVVCAINGVALGGGCEIAMGCHARVAPKGLKVLAGQPEVNLGIIPGAGGTQRLPRWVGFGVANEMLRTGRPIPSERALEIGLVDLLVDENVVEAAVALARDILDGEYTPRPIDKGPLDVPDALDDVDIGHLSRAVDSILCRAILEGGAMALDGGLRLEARLFAEACRTEDSRIGLKNFLEKGARSKAVFVHR